MAHQDQPGTPGSYERDSLFKRLRAKPENKVWLSDEGVRLEEVEREREREREREESEKERPPPPQSDERTLADETKVVFCLSLPASPSCFRRLHPLERWNRGGRARSSGLG